MKPLTSSMPKQSPPRRSRQTSLAASTEDLHERIAIRAHEIYEQRVRQSALDDWLQAEREILGRKKEGKPEVPHRGAAALEEDQTRQIRKKSVTKKK